MDRLHITGLKSAYGRHQVLQDVNLTVQQGQIIGIVGANGCGKSTFLQILAGLRTPDDGSIYLDGQQVKGRAGRSLLLRYMGYVPQESNLIQELSVRISTGSRRNWKRAFCIHLVYSRCAPCGRRTFPGE